MRSQQEKEMNERRKQEIETRRVLFAFSTRATENDDIDGEEDMQIHEESNDVLEDGSGSKKHWNTCMGLL